jgi:diguanylate cyclase (GGDEF)-like protein
VRFRYRLSSLDPGWVETSFREVRYANLPEGSYVFDVLARSADGVWSPGPASIALRIRPPWWRAWWFDALLMGSGAAAIWRVWIARTAHLKKRHRMLENAVRDRTSQLQHLATTDGLTETRNRRAILEFLSDQLNDCARIGRPVAVVMIDVDRFKTINDQHGHVVGDLVLKKTAERLISGMRSSDAIGRYGGEEFLIVLPGCNESDATSRATQLQQVFEKFPISLASVEHPVTCSFGVTWTRDSVYDMDQLIREADTALYCAKNSGRNRVVVSRNPVITLADR